MTPWTATCQAPLSFTISQSLLKFMSIESVMPSKHFILSPSSPFTFNLSQHWGLFLFLLLFIYLFILFVVNFVIHWNETAMGLHVFPIPNESALLIRWPKYWTFSFSINPSDGYSGLISFRIDWFYLLAVQGTLKSLLPHYSLKASILQHSAFFMLQLSYLYMINGKTIALTIWSSVF